MHMRITRLFGCYVVDLQCMQIVTGNSVVMERTFMILFAHMNVEIKCSSASHFPAVDIRSYNKLQCRNELRLVLAFIIFRQF
jgi:hypothetical protein